MVLPCNEHIIYPHLDDGVFNKLVLANLYIMWDILMICPFSVVNSKVIVVVCLTGYGIRKTMGGLIRHEK